MEANEERRPRVVMLMRQFHPIRGGYENQALRLAEEMLRHDVDVQVLTQRHGTLAPYEVHHDVRIHRISTLGKGHLAALSYLVAAFAWAVRHRRTFQIIHTNRTTSGLVAGLIGSALRRPVLCKVTGGGEIDGKGLRSSGLGRFKVQCLKRTVDRFVAITPAIARDLAHIGIPPEKIVRIPNGIEAPSVPADRVRSRVELDLDPDAPIAVFVGRIIPEKGLDWLLESWTGVVREMSSARLLLVGEGGERAALEARARNLGLDGSVRFVGHRDDVERFLGAADVFVLPSSREGMSNALLEAMACGLPAVASDDLAGGNREIVRDGENGILVPFGDRQRLVAALRELFAVPERRRRLGDEARASVQCRYSMERVAERYRALYAELLSAGVSS